MKSFNPCQNFPDQWRRGNALVLVSAMLVLLVLLATAFLARTQSQRSTASAMQDASGDDRRIDLIKDQLASEIAMHLFVKPIDSKGSASYIGGDSAGNRIPPGMRWTMARSIQSCWRRRLDFLPCFSWSASQVSINMMWWRSATRMTMNMHTSILMA